MKNALRYGILPLLGFGLVCGLIFESVKFFPFYACGLLAVIIVAGYINNRRLKKKEEARGWRIGREGRDGFYYAELRDGKWKRLDFYGDMLIGKPRFCLYLSSIAFPVWAKDRHTEILDRIKKELPAPDYEYKEEPMQRSRDINSGASPLRV